MKDKVFLKIKNPPNEVLNLIASGCFNSSILKKELALLSG